MSHVANLFSRCALLRILDGLGNRQTGKPVPATTSVSSTTTSSVAVAPSSSFKGHVARDRGKGEFCDGRNPPAYCGSS